MVTHAKNLGVAFLFTFGLLITAGVADSDLPILGMLKWSAIGFGLMVLGALLVRRWPDE